jgi:hypothetical protein
MFLYVEGGNPRRTPLIGKIAIYGWKLTKIRMRSRTFRIRTAVAFEPIGKNPLNFISDGISDSQPGPTIDQAAAFEFKVVNEIRRPRH